MLRILDDIDNITAEQLQDAIAALPEWRQQVVMRYKFENSRKESAFAFRLLQEMTGIQEIQFLKGEHGKPSIVGYETVHFNLSHCKRAVACVVDDKPCGVDVECTGRYSQSLAEHTLSPVELAALDQADDVDIAFTILWTKKESLLKLLGSGITDDIKNILHQYEDKVQFETIISNDRSYVCTTASFTV